jgi:hypothetical protein
VKGQVLEQEGTKSGCPKRDLIERRGELRLVYIIGAVKKIRHEQSFPRREMSGGL